MNKFIILVFLLFSFRLTFCQIDSYKTSQQFDSVSFTELTQFIESETDITFYFKNDWVNDIFFSINNHSSLLPQLSNQLLQKGISLYIEENSIILIKGKEPITKLPKFKSNFSPYIFSKDEIKRVLTESDRFLVDMKRKYSCVPMIIRLLYGTGMRIGEVLKLTPRDIDDRSRLLRFHQARRLPATQPGSLEVCVGHGFEGLERTLVNGRTHVDPGAVDQDIQSSKPIADRSKGILHTVFLRHIDRDG